MQPELDRQKDFWNTRANEYPDAESADHRARMLARLALVPADAQPRPGISVLDVGTGTGVFALHAAGRGAKVAALDIAPRMLERLAAHPLGGRIDAVHADWRAFDPASRGWDKAFDSVWAWMVPSFRDADDFRRLEACSRGWCVFVGWGRRRHDPWLEAAFAAHGAPWTVPAGVPLACELLRIMGRAVEPVFHAEIWLRGRDVEAAVRDAAGHLAVRGVTADPERLRRLAMERAVDGRLEDTAEVETGVLAWRV